MLRIIAATLALLALLAGCALGQDKNRENAAPQSEPSSQTAVPGPVAGVNAENYPPVDGSTANMPLMAHLYSKICGVPLENAEKQVPIVMGTAEAWRSMQWDGPGMIIAYEAPESVMEELENSGIELEITALGRDGLVFLINRENPVADLTVDQLQNIYSGDVTDWSELGGNAGPVFAYQRNDDSGSQTMFKKLVLAEPMSAPQELIPGSMGGLIESIADFDGSGAAIGFSVFYYADLMYANPNLKLLSVDGAAPSKESIGSGEYPLVNDFFVAIRADAPQDSPERLLRDWLASPEGASLLEEANYVPVK